MKDQSWKYTILLAQDNSNDWMLVEQAFLEIDLSSDLFFVQDGIELLQYLRKQGRFTGSTPAPRPDLILLDLNMPRKDGRQALAEIKTDPDLRSIPVVVLTNSDTQEDILRTYDLGGAGFIIKPQNFEGMVEVAKVLKQYWFEVVELVSAERVK
ncbi:MAG: two-component system response regulator [Chloroflexi bacterium RBG_19FT_COMBO_47_9]|nr:MAG: two-component system response regulator [Chloroflexi bacterium RBG_19FT_COMBO_47_9]